MRGRDLERDLGPELRAYYGAFTPADSVTALRGVVAAVERERATTAAARPLLPRLLPRLAAVGIAAVLLALVAGPSAWQRFAGVPAASTAAPTWPIATDRQPVATTVRPSPSASATTDARASLLDACAENAGVIPGIGFWAYCGPDLYISSNGGASWVRRDLPPRPGPLAAPLAVAFADAEHGWAVEPSRAADPPDGSNGAPLVVYRTADGGRSWSGVEIPGTPSSLNVELAVVDPLRAFLQTPGGADGQPMPTIFRTMDGGRSWRATSSVAVGPIVASDPDTLWTWSTGSGARCSDCNLPLLRVSRDAGATWTSAELPGLAGARSGDAVGIVAAPVFFDGSNGLVAVRSGGWTPPAARTDVFRTRDGGRTWTLAAHSIVAFNTFEAADADHWFANAAADPPFEVVTDDGGGTWKTPQSNLPGFDKSGSLWADAQDGAIVATLPGEPAVSGVPTRVLYVTSDGGLHWRLANFGAATR